MTGTRINTGTSGARNSVRQMLAITNLTSNTHIVPADEPDERQGKDLVIRPYDVAVTRDMRWQDDGNLKAYIERGILQVEVVTARPKGVPRRPMEADLGEPRLNNMITEIVFGPEARARDFINAEPRFENRSGNPLDVDWLKGTGLRVLRGALAWLKAWGPPAHMAWKVMAIEERIRWIQTEAQ